MKNVITEVRRAKIDSLREAARATVRARRLAGEPVARTLEEALGETFSAPVTVEEFIAQNDLEGDK